MWSDGAAYERYIGRWSRLIAREFVGWLDVPAGAAWLDFGCGTGALSQTVLAVADPRLVVGCDRSAAYVRVASEAPDPRARFVTAELPDLPRTPGGFDAAVSGLVLNFIPQPLDALAAMTAVVRPRGTVAAYVWDYADGMQMLRAFWDVAAEIDPAAADLDEGPRFAICHQDSLNQTFERAGLGDVRTRAIEVQSRFRDFDDVWSPFLGGQGPAPDYLARLTSDGRDQVRDRLRARLPVAADGSITLMARAWAARGIAP